MDFSQLSLLVSIAIRGIPMSSTIASPMRRSHQSSSYVVAVMAALALVMSGSTSAHAATAKDVVTIGTISNQTIPYSEGPYGTVTVKPKVSVEGHITVDRKVLTVTREGDTSPVVYRKKSATLDAGTYTVQTKVRYRTYTNVVVDGVSTRQYAEMQHKSKTQSLRVAVAKPHACTKTSSGTCIKGGQFCPQKSYGKIGYDAYDKQWRCTGDHTHPHWLEP